MLTKLATPLAALSIAVAAWAFGTRTQQQVPVARDPALVGRTQTGRDFAGLIARLSEQDQYFDTDNLITNERSYLHVIGKLDELSVEGGAYIGVGPGQNFSYIAQVRPSIAFMVDIRRDNLLQHLLYKALFELADSRMEFLCLWLGRGYPSSVAPWLARSLPDLVEYIDQAPVDDARVADGSERIHRKLVGFGVPLTDGDIETIDRFHHAFIADGLDLRFSSHGRAPLPDYPTLRQLLLETDLEGTRRHYLASEGTYRFVKSLQMRDLIVPVVGDLAGSHALSAIGDLLRERGETVSTFYTSNVEFYLVREGRFGSFVTNLASLPLSDRSLLVRSYFNRGFRARHPQAVPGYSSTQLLQAVRTLLDDYAAGRLKSYRDIVTMHSIPLR